MDGIQKTIYLALMELAEEVKNEKYGTGDLFDMDREFYDAIYDDIIDVLHQ